MLVPSVRALTWRTALRWQLAELEDMRSRGHNYVGTFLVKDSAASAVSNAAAEAGSEAGDAADVADAAADAPRPGVEPSAELDPDAAAAGALASARQAPPGWTPAA